MTFFTDGNMYSYSFWNMLKIWPGLKPYFIWFLVIKMLDCVFLFLIIRLNLNTQAATNRPGYHGLICIKELNAFFFCICCWLAMIQFTYFFTHLVNQKNSSGQLVCNLKNINSARELTVCLFIRISLFNWITI